SYVIPAQAGMGTRSVSPRADTQGASIRVGHLFQQPRMAFLCRPALALRGSRAYYSLPAHKR
ncbi:MAG: hypothetical protein LLG44_11590, partial [Chloroflexi bacterium]|nr:hypothetical protein [Chloroflexota bacterium]